MRSIALAVTAVAIGCGPDAAPEFAGEYRNHSGSSVCKHDHPDASSFTSIWYLADPFVIDERIDGVFELAVPIPPCGIEGHADGDGLVLAADDCAEAFAAAPQLEIEAHSVLYSDIRGVARWEDDVLVIELEAGRRYSRVLGRLPEWWDDPGSCRAEYRMSRIE